jgi:predicted transcriptional regulator
LPIDDSYRGRSMTSGIVGATKLSAQLQMAPKLRQNNGWDFTRGSKRGRLEIIAEILHYCNKQKTKTNIMYKVNLNYSQLKKHLKSLSSQGLLTTDKNEYVTTQKGQRFLELFVQLNNILTS